MKSPPFSIKNIKMFKSICGFSTAKIELPYLSFERKIAIRSMTIKNIEIMISFYCEWYKKARTLIGLENYLIKIFFS